MIPIMRAASGIAIRLVVDGLGNVLERNEPRIVKAVLRESAAASIGRCLQAVVERGTGKSANTVAGAHGKTGTTTDNKDTWFVGYTPELVTAVWACNRQVKPHLDAKGKPVMDKNGKPQMNERYLEMDSDATGGHVAAPIWGRFMQAAVPIQQRNGSEPIALAEEVQRQRKAAAQSTPKAPPTPRPDSINQAGQVVITICQETSKRATAFCPDVVEKAFARGTKINFCRVHRAPSEESVTRAESGDVPTPSPNPDLSASPGRRRQREQVREERQAAAQERALQERAPSEEAPAEVEILLCAETNKRATDYCPEKITRSFPAGTKMRRCTRHKAPPGEEGR